MMPVRTRAILLVASFTLFTLNPEYEAKAETFVGSDNDSRVIIALAANEDAVQAMLPQGWTLMPFPEGALAGANTLLVLVDRYLATDAEGKPSDPSSYRGAALASLAKEAGSDSVRLFVTRTYATEGGYDPYSNGQVAEIRRSATVESEGGVAPRLSEAWTIAPSGGGALRFSIDYQSGTPSWSTSEALPYSNVNPDFHRIYRYDQLADLAMSAPLDRALDGDMSLGSDIGDLVGLFDGNERIVAVVVVPMYFRKVLLP